MTHVQVLAKSSEWFREKDRFKDSGFIFEGKELHFFPFPGHDFLTCDGPSFHANFFPNVCCHIGCSNQRLPEGPEKRLSQFKRVDREEKSQGFEFMRPFPALGKIREGRNLYWSARVKCSYLRPGKRSEKRGA